MRGGGWWLTARLAGGRARAPALLLQPKPLLVHHHLRLHSRPPQVARCTKIINPNTDDAKYVINVKQIAKFVVGLGDRVAPADIEEGMRVGVDRNKYQIQIPLPPKIDPTVTMMTVEEKVTARAGLICVARRLLAASARSPPLLRARRPRPASSPPSAPAILSARITAYPSTRTRPVPHPPCPPPPARHHLQRHRREQG